MKKWSMKKLLMLSLLCVFSSLSFTGLTAEASKQGPYIKDGSYVQITKKNYEMWQNFNWKKKNNTSNVYQKTYQARGKYKHQNGSTYYSLYDSKGNWKGYLNANATKKVSKQGDYIKDGRYVSIINPNYLTYHNFNWKVRGSASNFMNRPAQARGRYEHFNGSTYYSIYNADGTWLGYLNAAATKTTKAEGPYIPDGTYVRVTKKNYSVWQNFSWKKKGSSSSLYNQKYLAKGRYDHFNYSMYYSLYDLNGKWVGYINQSATEVFEPKVIKEYKTVNKDTNGNLLQSTNGYSFIKESTDGGKTTKYANGDSKIVYTTTKIWKKNSVDPNHTSETKTINLMRSGGEINNTDYLVYVSESTDKGVVTNLGNGKTHTVYTRTVIWDPPKGRKTSNSELFIGDWRPGNEGMYTNYYGIGNTGMTFASTGEADTWAFFNLPEDKHNWWTWEVLINKTKEVRYTVNFGND